MHTTIRAEKFASPVTALQWLWLHLRVERSSQN